MKGHRRGIAMLGWGKDCTGTLGGGSSVSVAGNQQDASAFTDGRGSGASSVSPMVVMQGACSTGALWKGGTIVTE